MQPRSLRVHAKRHAKSQQPPREPLWTDKRVSALKVTVPRTAPFDVTTLGVSSSEELDRAARTLLTELGRLQSESKRNARTRGNTATSTVKDRIVVGLRQTHRDIVTATPRLILLSKRVECGEGKGTPAEQIREIVAIAKQRQIPIAAVLSRREVCFNASTHVVCDVLVFHGCPFWGNRLEEHSSHGCSVGATKALVSVLSLLFVKQVQMKVSEHL